MIEPIAPQELADAAAVLASGGVVCVPTESSYALAADLRHPAACERVGVLKSREAGSPFAVIAGDLGQAQSLTEAWPKAATDLVARHWPGPLTLVVPARVGLPIETISSRGEIGVRVSSHPWARALAQALGGPFTATSANRRGQDPATSAAAARRAFAGDIDFYLDAGDTPGGAPSTVVGFDGDTLRVFRAGAIRLASDSG